MKRTTLIPLVLVAGLGWGLPAVAQQAPQILEVQDGQGNPTAAAPVGGMVVVVGEYLHTCIPVLPDMRCNHDELEVKVDGRECLVTSSSAEQIAIVLPQFGVDPGRTQLEVSIQGRGRARVPFELLALDDPDARGPQEGAQNPFERQVRDSFSLRVEHQRRDGRDAFLVEGRALGLPESVTASVTLVLRRPLPDGRIQQISTVRAEVRDQAFEQRIASWGERELPLGTYFVDMVFERGDQSRANRRLERWFDGLEADHRAAYDLVFIRQHAVAGTQEAQQAQRERVANHYRNLASDCLARFDDVEAAWAEGCRVFFREQGQTRIDREAYLDYLVRTGAAEDEATADEIAGRRNYADADGYLELEALEGLLRRALLADPSQDHPDSLAALRERHEAFLEGFAAEAPPRPDLDGHWTGLLAVANGQAAEWTRLLYARSELEEPTLLRQIPAMSGDDEVSPRAVHAKAEQLAEAAR
jgi:hypothetical protein